MPFKHYIRSIEGKTQTVQDKPFHPKPEWFGKFQVERILNPYMSCVQWFTWNATPQKFLYWNQYSNLPYDRLPPEPREIIDSWIAQVNGDN